MVPEFPGLPFAPDAVWIGSDHPFDLHEAYLNFRSPAGWQVNPKSRPIELFITADSRYKLWVNGQFVARGPARSYPHCQAVDRLDITDRLQPGQNLLAVQVYQPGYSHFSYVHRAAAGLLAQLVTGNRPLLHTGSHWRVRRDPAFAANVPRVSIYGSGVEDVDLNQAEQWPAPDFDDSGWAPARVVAPPGGAPWSGLQRRRLPLLTEREQPLTLIEFRRGAILAHLSAGIHRTLAATWRAAQQESLSQDAGGWFAPALAAGEFTGWLFDLGRDFAIQGWAEIEGATGGEQLFVSYAEKIRDGQLVISDPATYCRVRLTDRFWLRPGAQTVQGFSLRGGRYLLFGLTGPAGPNFRLRFHARVSEYPLRITRPLAAPDPQLSAIISLCENTVTACLQDGFVDSTWRESSQWLGDALPQSLVLASLGDDTGPLRQVVEMAAQGAYPDGLLPGVLPGEVHPYAVVDYNFMWVELLRLHFRLTGDAAFAAEMWPVLQKMLARFRQDTGLGGLITSPPGRRLFLDWSPQSRAEPSAVYNLHYLRALQQAAHLAGEFGHAADDARMWRERAQLLASAVRGAFWQNGRWYDDVEQSTFSQLAAALALLTGAALPGTETSLLDAIAARSLDPADEPSPGKMVLASPFMHHYVFEALRQGGRAAQVIEIIRRRWGRWADAGYPTTWENWAVDFPDGSQCHAFSAHPRYHLAEIARQRGSL